VETEEKEKILLREKWCPLRGKRETAELLGRKKRKERAFLVSTTGNSIKGKRDKGFFNEKGRTGRRESIPSSPRGFLHTPQKGKGGTLPLPRKKRGKEQK